jgi:H+/Cl- antiporter ClcA
VLTLVIGVVVGLTIVAFVVLTERVGLRLYPVGAQPWRRLFMPVVGSVLTGYLLYRYFPNARGSGIPQTKTALFVGGGRITLRTVFGKFLCSSTSLASGNALGREGPSVHIGAGIASVLGRWLRLSPKKVESLLPVGAAAALAAAFNTPIAAVLFALEEVMGDLHAPLIGSVVLSSATSWMILHLVLGDEPLFHVPPYALVLPVEFVFYAVLGLIGGLVSVWFVKMILWMRPRFLAMPEKTRWIQPAAGGLLVGILAWFVPQVLEMARDYSIIVPLMISNLVSFYISCRLQRHPIYEALALQDGVHLPSPSTHRMTSQLRVRAAMRPPELTIEPTTNPDSAIRLMIDRRVHQLPVSEGSKFLGMLSKTKLEASRPDTPEVGAILGNSQFPHLHSDHTLDVALHRMGSSNMQELPVVSRRDVHTLEGIVALEDVLRLYGIGKTNWTTD